MKTHAKRAVHVPRHLESGKTKGAEKADIPVKAEVKSHKPASHFAAHAKGHEKIHATETKTSKSIDWGEKALGNKTLNAHLQAGLRGAIDPKYSLEINTRHATDSQVLVTLGSVFREFRVSIDSQRLRLHDGRGAGPLGPPPEMGGLGTGDGGSSLLGSVKLEDYVGKNGVDLKAAMKDLFRDHLRGFDNGRPNGDGPTYV